MWFLNFLFGSGRFEGGVADFGLLVGRLGFGLMLAFAHGVGKMPPSEGLAGMIGGMGFPAPMIFAWCLALTELIGALLIAIGLFTRPAALAVLVAMAVAAFIKHGPDAFEVKELALVYMCFGLIYLFTGAGKYAFDRLIFRPD